MRFFKRTCYLTTEAKEEEEGPGNEITHRNDWYRVERGEKGGGGNDRRHTKTCLRAPSSLPSFNVLQNRCLFLPPNPLGYYDPPAGGNQAVIVCKQTVRKPNYQLSLAFGSVFHQRKPHQAHAYEENLGGGIQKLLKIFSPFNYWQIPVSALLQCLFFPPPPPPSPSL